MAKASKNDSEHRQMWSEAARRAREAGVAPFQGWFDTSCSVRESVVSGYWDMAVHVLTPAVCRALRQPLELTALEIGCGGGRVLNAACSFFGEVIGIDIHGEFGAVKEFLASQGKSNFRILPTDGRSINIPSDSVDFVYSFIVLQHVQSFEVFSAYLRETYRVLKVGGVAQLYFGRYETKFSVMRRVQHSARGYIEISDAPVGDTTLVVHRRKCRRLCVVFHAIPLIVSHGLS